MKRAICLAMALATACALLAGYGSSASETAGAGSASAGSAAASSNTAAGASGTEGGTYYIACGAPFTGDDAQYGNFFKKALDMKMNEINASGGINGKMIQIDYFDDKSTPKEASNIAQMVTSDSKYIAEIGSYNSTCVLAGAPIYQEAGMVQMAPTAGHPDITTANDHLFRLQNSNDVEYTWLADVAVNKIGAKKIAIVHLENDSGIVLSEILNEQIPAMGGEVVLTESYVQGQVSDFSSILTKLKSAAPELIICVTSYNDMGTMLQQAKQIDLGGVKWVSSGMIYSDDFLKLAGDAGEGVYSMTIFFADNPDGRIAAFTEKYRSLYNESPNYFATNAYEALAMIEAALKNGAGDRASLYSELLKIKEWDGETGYATFDENRMVNRGMTVIRVENGKWVVAPENDQ
ncbi:ABC transporter substrate-binding protein [Anaerotruncus colihominis]|uniref:ABC transporter substrate-binding protein n=1 Tax=Anaerotruncus colihominis TaxID=169435 RepID=UPI003AB81003